MTIEESVVESLKVAITSDKQSDKMKELCCMIINDPGYLKEMLTLVNGICIIHPELGAAFTLQMLGRL